MNRDLYIIGGQNGTQTYTYTGRSDAEQKVPPGDGFQCAAASAARRYGGHACRVKRRRPCSAVPEGEDEYVIELINPEIIETYGEQDGPEGCLSVPGEYGLVKRPMNVRVRAQDRFGEWFEVEGTGLTARCFCHEIDHLEGILFTEKCERMLTEEEMSNGEY